MDTGMFSQPIKAEQLDGCGRTTYRQRGGRLVLFAQLLALGCGHEEAPVQEQVHPSSCPNWHLLKAFQEMIAA